MCVVVHIISICDYIHDKIDLPMKCAGLNIHNQKNLQSNCILINQKWNFVQITYFLKFRCY